jgi:hypothetical protein
MAAQTRAAPSYTTTRGTTGHSTAGSEAASPTATSGAIFIP